MWSFNSYQRQETIIPETVIMSMRSGLESRYADRFRGYAGTTEETIKNTDTARKNADSLRTAAGVVDAQKENVDDLFMAAELMVKMINDFQRETGVTQIKNIPLAGASIKESHGKKLGYTKLSMKFVSAGLLHFMEISLNMMEDLKAKDKIIQSIAEHRVDIPILGRLTEVDLDDLSSDDPVVETKLPLSDDDDIEMMKEITSPEKSTLINGPITPPKTPSVSDKKGGSKIQPQAKSPTPAVQKAAKK